LGCDPERVTGYVDGELPPSLEREAERHLFLCPICAAQAVFEIELRERVKSSTDMLPPPGLPGRILAAAPRALGLIAH